MDLPRHGTPPPDADPVAPTSSHGDDARRSDPWRPDAVHNRVIAALLELPRPVSLSARVEAALSCVDFDRRDFPIEVIEPRAEHDQADAAGTEGSDGELVVVAGAGLDNWGIRQHVRYVLKVAGLLVDGFGRPGREHFEVTVPPLDAGDAAAAGTPDPDRPAVSRWTTPDPPDSPVARRARAVYLHHSPDAIARREAFVPVLVHRHGGDHGWVFGVIVEWVRVPRSGWMARIRTGGRDPDHTYDYRPDGSILPLALDVSAGTPSLRPTPPPAGGRGRAAHG